MQPQSWRAKSYAYGNTSTAPTFDVENGSFQTGTLTGNITPVVTAPKGNQAGVVLTIKLTQDGTGSRAFTAPSNVKLAGGAVTLTTTATTGVSILTFMFDGTNWVEIARSLAVA